MKRTCIICGDPTGSREHTFPATLGGRRTNKGIYCETHNGDYSPLAKVLSSQLKAINAMLGVRGDHDDHPHTVVTTDSSSAEQVTLTRGAVEFTNPEVVARSVEDNVQTVTVRYSNDRQLQKWIAEQRARGINLKTGARRSRQSYFLSGTQFNLLLGGPDGLRAIGYVALTFLAHHFPVVARSPGLEPFKAYTLGQGGKSKGYVWWDSEVPADLPQNAFAFGHRIIVGVDAAAGAAYARVSLFSTLHFAMLFGAVCLPEAKAVIIDIDPLAVHPPRDILERSENAAVAAVNRLHSFQTISANHARQSMERLIQRIYERDMYIAADRILEMIRDANLMDAPTRTDMFESAVYSCSQIILNAMRNLISRLKVADPQIDVIAPALDLLVASDPSAPNGLSVLATTSLALARQVLTAQMMDDHAHGLLNRDRLALLLGGNPGAAVLGRYVLEPVIRSLGRA